MGSRNGGYSVDQNPVGGTKSRITRADQRAADAVYKEVSKMMRSSGVTRGHPTSAKGWDTFVPLSFRMSQSDSGAGEYSLILLGAHKGRGNAAL